MCALDIEPVQQFREVSRIDQRRMIRRDRTIYIRIVVAAGIYDNAVLLREPIELREPLAVVLQSSVNEDNRTTGSFFGVIQFDVTDLQGAVRELRFGPPFHYRQWASPMSRSRW